MYGLDFSICEVKTLPQFTSVYTNDKGHVSSQLLAYSNSTSAYKCVHINCTTKMMEQILSNTDVV